MGMNEPIKVNLIIKFARTGGKSESHLQWLKKKRKKPSGFY